MANYRESKKIDNNGKEQVITKFTMIMKTPVRDDVLKYLSSNVAEFK